MHADSYVDFRSHAPPSTKRTVILSLFRRAILYCSNTDLLNEELNHIAKILHQHHYPIDFTINTLRNMKPIKQVQLPTQSMDMPTDSNICNSPTHHLIEKTIQTKIAKPGQCAFNLCRYCCLLLQWSDISKRTCKQHKWQGELTPQKYVEKIHAFQLTYYDNLPPLQGPALAPRCTIPYVHGVSEKVKKSLTKAGFCVFYQKSRTFRDLLCHLKDPITHDEEKEGVYELPFT